MQRRCSIFRNPNINRNLIQDYRRAGQGYRRTGELHQWNLSAASKGLAADAELGLTTLDDTIKSDDHERLTRMLRLGADVRDFLKKVFGFVHYRYDAVGDFQKDRLIVQILPGLESTPSKEVMLRSLSSERFWQEIQAKVKPELVLEFDQRVQVRTPGCSQAAIFFWNEWRNKFAMHLRNCGYTDFQGESRIHILLLDSQTDHVELNLDRMPDNLKSLRSRRVHQKIDVRSANGDRRQLTVLPTCVLCQRRLISPEADTIFNL